MYDEIVEIAQNRQFLEAVKDGYSQGPNMNLLNTLRSYAEVKHLEKEMNDRGEITFDSIFHEPLGYYLIKCFLIHDYSVDKAIFVSDVELFKTLVDPSARLRVSKRIYDTFVSPGSAQTAQGKSVFDNQQNQSLTPSKVYQSVQSMTHTTTITTANPQALHLKDVSNNQENNGKSANVGNSSHQRGTGKKGKKGGSSSEMEYINREHNEPLGSNLNDHETNALGVYGPCVDELRKAMEEGSTAADVFDVVLEELLKDLRNDVFPRFVTSSLYKLYIQCKVLEQQSVTHETFDTLRVLGRGAFGFVNASIKKDTGQLYAMKCLNKRRVMATDSVDTIMAERNFLADMESRFVTGLKYAVMDGENLYLIIDLMVGGDLKFHLNKDGRFDVRRSRFYAAEVLLGIEHIHSKGIIYRDIKLENVLLDSDGHCKISDLGLAVRTKDKVRGYAGTPGYTAPEVCLQQAYDRCADFFSYGVMIYRFLSGKKPFQPRKSKHRQQNGRDRDPRRQGNELDKNVVEMEPEYSDHYFSASAKSLLKGLLTKDPRKRLGRNGIIELKIHPWFDTIDFGLLEAGYLDPPFIPNQDEINADSLRHIGRPPNDDKYAKINLTPQFEQSLNQFPYVSKPALQEEIVTVLERIHSRYNFEKFADNAGEITVTQLAGIPSMNELFPNHKFDDNNNIMTGPFEFSESSSSDEDSQLLQLLQTNNNNNNQNNTNHRPSGNKLNKFLLSTTHQRLDTNDMSMSDNNNNINNNNNNNNGNHHHHNNSGKPTRIIRTNKKKQNNKNLHGKNDRVNSNSNNTANENKEQNNVSNELHNQNNDNNRNSNNNNINSNNNMHHENIDNMNMNGNESIANMGDLNEMNNPNGALRNHGNQHAMKNSNKSNQNMNNEHGEHLLASINDSNNEMNDSSDNRMNDDNDRTLNESLQQQNDKPSNDKQKGKSGGHCCIVL